MLTNTIALRLYPVFPYHIRQAFSDCILPTGGSNDSKSPIFVKAGTLFDANFAVLHRRPEIWGADAEEFRPERWDSFRPKAWEYVPFGGGTRACVGRQKALMETSYLVVRLVREFGGIEARDEREWRGQVQVTAKNFNGCKVAFTAVGR
jgi:cytochrome P450